MVSEKLCRNTLKERVHYNVHISQIFYRRSRRLARSSQVKTNHFFSSYSRPIYSDGVTYVSVVICALHLLQLSWPLSGRFLLSLPHYDVGIIGSMLPCVCLVIDHRWRQNVIKKNREVTHEPRANVSPDDIHILLDCSCSGIWASLGIFWVLKGTFCLVLLFLYILLVYCFFEFFFNALTCSKQNNRKLRVSRKRWHTIDDCFEDFLQFRQNSCCPRFSISSSLQIALTKFLRSFHLLPPKEFHKVKTYLEPHTIWTKQNKFPLTTSMYLYTLMDHGQWSITTRIAFTSFKKRVQFMIRTTQVKAHWNRNERMER